MTPQQTEQQDSIRAERDKAQRMIAWYLSGHRSDDKTTAHAIALASETLRLCDKLEREL